MLGHHDFLLGQYASALACYEVVIRWGAPSKAVRKRAIVCYIQTGQPEKALPLFKALVEEDAPYILEHNDNLNGCPCPVIIQKFVNTIRNPITQADRIALGVLWSYSDLHLALLWFNKALQQAPENSSLKAIIAGLSSQTVMVS